jgi:IclR family acetate operon transcriptional repressor
MTDAKTKTDGNTYKIRSVDRVLDILDLLSSAEGLVTLSAVAEATGMPRSSTFRYLTALERRGYAERDVATGHFRLGPGFPAAHDRRIDDIVKIAGRLLDELAAGMGETMNLGLLTGTRIRYLLIIESPRQVRLAARAGDRDPLHCTALGKAIAAGLPEREVRRILELEGMPRKTPQTITSIERLLDELELVRTDGYALDDGENEVDGRCVAVRIPTDALHAAVSLSAPAARFPRDEVEDAADQLRAVAKRIADELASDPRRSQF